MRTLRYLVILLILPVLLSGQVSRLPGLPFIHNYSKDTYRGGTQNWDFCQDEAGRLYVANNEGLLAFDGVTWQRFPLPNKTIVRSVAYWPGHGILAGGQNELGLFQPDGQGILRYHSLDTLLPSSSRNFADVWDICIWGGVAYIRTAHELFRYDGTALTLLRDGPELRFMGSCLGRLLVQESGTGLLEVRGDSLRLLPGTSALADILVTACLPYDSTAILIATFGEGLWHWEAGRLRPWPTSHDALLRQYRIGAAVRLSDSTLVLGTARGGLLSLSSQGQLIQVLQQAQDLQDNNVLALFVSANKDLWAGLNYGIDQLRLHAPYSRIYPDGDLRGTAYAAAYHRGRFYFGTSNGLYTAGAAQLADPALATPWQLVPGTEGQVWGLQVVGDHLLMGHHEGAFLIQEAQASRIAGTAGVWTFLALPDDSGHVLAGTYEGLVLLQARGDRYVFRRRLDGLSVSCRFLVPDAQGGLWVTHPYLGVFHLQLDETLRLEQVRQFGPAEGLPSLFYNHVFPINDLLVFAGEHGLYEFDEASGRFARAAAFTDIFAPDQRIIRLVESPEGHIWYAAEGEVGVLWVSDAGLRKDIRREVLPSLKDRLMGGFELIYPLDSSHIFFGSEKGFLHYNPQASPPELPAWQAVVSEVRTTTQDEAVIFGGFGPLAGQDTVSPTLPAAQNAFRFACGAPGSGADEPLAFRYRLRGWEENWTNWHPLPVKEYTNLPPGRYTFEVEARYGQNRISVPGRFSFQIAPPWYASPVARGLYLLLGMALFAWLLVSPRRRFAREKAALESEHRKEREGFQQEIVQTQAQIDSLLHDKLQAEVHHKSQELASATMHLVQKNEVLAEVRDKLAALVKAHPGHPGKVALRELISTLNQDQQLDRDWEQFAYHFDQVHANFLRRLQDQFPQLTPKDHRLCAYLRLNLSTKEIAPLMNISVRGVEISRYRLRKKLELGRDVNLNEFMMQF